MSNAIGAGENRAYIYDRKGQTRLDEIPLADITWNRVLSDISRPTITVAPPNCTPKMNQLIHPWGVSLVIYRDNDRVWEGPVRKRTDSKTGMTITASDVIGWTERRVVRTARAVTGVKVRDELVWNIQQAFSRDNPNVLAYLTTLPGALGTVTTDHSLQASGYYSADLQTLVSAGGRYTALGRSIMLWDEAYTLGRTETLVPEKHILSDVTITEDGDDLITAAYAQDDSGDVGYYPGTGTELDAYYGLVEQAITVGSGAYTSAALLKFGQSAHNSGYPTPVTIDMPTDAPLQCDAPFPIDSLVPGMLVPVETVTATARKVSATMILSSVTVSQQAGDQETVSLGLSPLSAAVS